MSNEEIIGWFTRNSQHSVDFSQAEAWHAELAVLKDALATFTGHLLLEFDIPRMGRRIDAVVITGAVVFVVEFKVGADGFDRNAIVQVWDYALDLKNVHAASYNVPIVPILVSTHARSSPNEPAGYAPDGVYHPILSDTQRFNHVIDTLFRKHTGTPIDVQDAVPLTTM